MRRSLQLALLLAALSACTTSSSPAPACDPDASFGPNGYNPNPCALSCKGAPGSLASACCRSGGACPATWTAAKECAAAPGSQVQAPRYYPDPCGDLNVSVQGYVDTASFYVFDPSGKLVAVLRAGNGGPSCGPADTDVTIPAECVKALTSPGTATSACAGDAGAGGTLSCGTADAGGGGG